jgi:hypothetical protein
LLIFRRCAERKLFHIEVASFNPDPDSKANIRPPQSLYDAVARRSEPDRYLRRAIVDPRPKRHHDGKPVGPEQVLAHRWREQLKRIGEDIVDDDETDGNTKAVETGLVLSGERDAALPDSVRVLALKLVDGQDLLKALHQYTSDFFNRQGLEDVCSRQFDETALLTMGMSFAYGGANGRYNYRRAGAGIVGWRRT